MSGILTVTILIGSAVGITHNDRHVVDEPTPTISASPGATLNNPEPVVITADKDAVLPEEVTPEVVTEAAPSIPLYRQPSTPYYVPPFTGPQYPLTGPQQGLSQPNVPSPVQPLPHVVPSPVEGHTRPPHPITDPLLGTVKRVIPSVLK